MGIDDRYDVIVIGAGPGGFAAALGAVRQGARVLLIDQNSGPGGVAAFSGCPVFSGISTLEPGHYNSVTSEFIAELQKLDAARIIGHTLTSSEVAVQLAMSRLLQKQGVKLLFYATLVGAEVSQHHIESVQVFCAGQHMSFTAASFVDASGDAVLAHLAGAKVICGTPEDSMTRTVLFRLANVKSFDKSSLKERFASKKFPYPIQDCFMGTTPCDGTVLMNLTAVAGDALDPWDLTRMDLELREQVAIILPWLQHEFPEFSEARLVAVAPRIGVRASRNIAGRQLLRCADIDDNRPVIDPVAIGKRSYGEHFVRSFSSPWRKSHDGPQPIPYGALLAEPLQNLAAAGRCIAVETRAISSIRLMPCCLATGLAAGTAAAMQFPEYNKLAATLKEQKCQLD